ncbi:MAG: hypothetical protein AAF443_07080 [Chlamydiota bacterium]
MREFPVEASMFLALFQLLIGKRSGVIAGSFSFSPLPLLQKTPLLDNF